MFFFVGASAAQRTAVAPAVQRAGSAAAIKLWPFERGSLQPRYNAMCGGSDSVKTFTSKDDMVKARLESAFCPPCNFKCPATPPNWILDPKALAFHIGGVITSLHGVAP